VPAAGGLFQRAGYVAYQAMFKGSKADRLALPELQNDDRKSAFIGHLNDI